MRYVSEICVRRDTTMPDKSVRSEFSVIPFLGACVLEQPIDAGVNQYFEYMLVCDSETGETYKISMAGYTYRGFKEYMSSLDIYGYAGDYLVTVDRYSILFLDYVSAVERVYKDTYSTRKYVNYDKDRRESLFNVQFLHDSENTLLSFSAPIGNHLKYCTLFQFLSICNGSGWYGDSLYIRTEFKKVYRVVFNDVESAKRMIIKAKTSGIYRDLEKILRAR